jgi:GntR family transcriptional regulator, vanillate catabolism transcriptional regulator
MIVENKTRNFPNSEVASQTGRTLLNLRDMLLRGDFRAGDRISELPLVARLGVSRTPIRLALDRLAHEGLLETAPTGGFVVRGFTLADIWDALDLRGVLEGTAARLAAERFVHSSDLDTLRKYLDLMDVRIPTSNMDVRIPTPAIDGFAKYMEYNEAFHAEIVALSRNPLLRKTLDHLMAIPFVGPSAVVSANLRLPNAMGNFAVGQEHHHAIVESIERRQGARADAMAQEHARLSRRNLEAILADPSLLSQVRGASLIKMTAAV